MLSLNKAGEPMQQGRDAPMKSTLITLAMTGISLAMVLPAAAKPAPDPTPHLG